MTHDSDNTRISHWGFHNPVRLVFGVDRLNDLPKLVKERRALLVTTPGFTRRGITDRVRRLVGPSLVKIVDTVGPNPELDDLQETARRLHETHVDVIVAVGGGSAIDTAKAVGAVLSTTRETGVVFSLRKHVENDGTALNGVGIPVIAVPTTAGTGSEVTPFATIWDSVNRRKYSLSGSQLFPEIALLDPLLSTSLPRDITTTSGLDAISHSFEAIWNRNATRVTTLYATEALKLAMPILERVVCDPDNVSLRAQMLHASVYAGLAISNTKTALAHSISYPITMHYGVPHGLACSFALPAILRLNSGADDGRLHELALALGQTSVHGLHASVTRLLYGLGVQEALSHYVDSSIQFQELVREMLTPDRAHNNMRFVDHDDLQAVLEHSGT